MTGPEALVELRKTRDIFQRRADDARQLPVEDAGWANFIITAMGRRVAALDLAVAVIEATPAPLLRRRITHLQQEAARGQEAQAEAIRP